MDLALIAIIISALVLVLQIITLVRIAGTQKTLTRLQAAPQPMPSNDRDRMGRRDNDFRRHDRRPFQDQKQRPQPQQPPPQQPPQQQQPLAGSSPAPAAGDGLEKSLRDINLRLKNAERDQESARRRMQENMPRDGYRNRDDRDRGRHRGGRDRHGNRDNNRGNWQDRRDRQDRQNRPPQSFPQNQAAPAIAPAAPSNEPLFEKKDSAPLEPVTPVQEMTPVTNIQENIQEQSPSDYGSEEALQHGRKIIVKRRPLSSDESADTPLENSQTSSQPAAAEISGPEEETTMGSDSPGSEIKFGRR